MMLQRLQQTIAISSLLLIVAKTTALSTRSGLHSVLGSSPPSRVLPSLSVLNAGVVFTEENDNYESDETNRGIFLVSRATACMNSEACSLEEAESYLDEMLRVQNNSSVGDVDDLITRKDTPAICAEIIVGLRKKIDAQQKQVSLERTIINTMKVLAGMYVAFAIFNDFASATSLPADPSIFGSSLDTIVTGGAADNSVTAITLYQDWLYLN